MERPLRPLLSPRHEMPASRENSHRSASQEQPPRHEMPASHRSASQEQLQVLQERFFAHEKTWQKEVSKLLSRQERLEEEKSLMTSRLQSSDIFLMRTQDRLQQVENLVQERGTQQPRLYVSTDIDDLGALADWKRVQYLEDHMEKVEKTVQRILLNMESSGADKMRLYVSTDIDDLGAVENWKRVQYLEDHMEQMEKKVQEFLSTQSGSNSESDAHTPIPIPLVSPDAIHMEPPVLDQEMLDKLVVEVAELQDWRAAVDKHKWHEPADHEHQSSSGASDQYGVNFVPGAQSSDSKHEIVGKAYLDENEVLDSAKASDLETAELGDTRGNGVQEDIGEAMTSERLTDHPYCIQETTWDTCIFIGFDCVGVIGSLLILMGTLMSVAAECLFTLVVYANYSTHPFTDEMLDGLLHWRSSIAHHVNYADVDSQTSLAARVCAGASSTAISMYQMNSFSDLSAFQRSPIDELHTLNGQFLCNMALIMWIFAILQDVSVNYRFMVSVLAIPKGKASIRQFGDQFRIVSLRTWHVVNIVILVVLPRFVISMLLGYVGTLFLAYTSNVGELLLNAVALVFVLDIDEMLYQALVPEDVKILVQEVEPLEGWKGGSSRLFVFRIVATSLAIVICNIFIMQPFQECLEKAMKYLCSGRLDILYMQNKVNDLVMYSETPVYDPQHVSQMSYRKMAVLELIGLGDSEDLRRSAYEQNASLELSLSALWASHYGDRNYAAGTFLCIDHLDEVQVKATYAAGKDYEFLTASRLMFDDALDMPTIENCSQLNFSEICMSVDHVAARGLCARHCGCDNPWSGQFFATGLYGCPASCERRWQLNAYYLTPPSISNFTHHCMDVPANVLRNEPSWRAYLKGFASFSALFLSRDEDFQKFNAFLLDVGCDAIGVVAGFLDLCIPSENFRSARLWCPSTCQCTASSMEECPHTCSYTKNYQLFLGGKSCPAETSITSPGECESAFSTIKDVWFGPGTNGKIAMDGSIPYVTAGCAVFRGMLMWSTWNGTEMDPAVWALCRQPGVRLPMDKYTGGNFEYGKYLAQCNLDGTC